MTYVTTKGNPAPDLSDGKFIQFRLVHDTGKTFVYDVLANDETKLGELRWYGPWRCYSFVTWQENTVFETDCLATIQRALDTLKQDRKARRAGKAA